MTKVLKHDQVIALLKKRRGGRTDKQLAEELGISAPYLSDILHGNREPGPSVLRMLGLTKETTYRQVS